MNKKNLANAQIETSISSVDTTIAVGAGQGADLPNTPFFATITPYGQLSTVDNSEIVEVTDVNIDTLTVVRGQRGTTAKAFTADAVLANGIYVEDLDAKVDDTALTDALPSTVGTNGQVLKSNGTSVTWQDDTDTTYSEITSAEITAGTASTARTITGRRSEEIVTKAVGQANGYTDIGLATKQDASNAVTTNTTQTISGDKTYTGDVDLTSANIYLPTIAFSALGTDGETGSGDTHIYSMSEEYDYGGCYSAGIFTAPYNGIYNFSAAFEGENASAEWMLLRFYVNGSLTRSTYARDFNGELSAYNGTGRQAVSGSVDLKLSVGDEVTFGVYSDDNQTLTKSNTYNFVTGHLVSRLP